MCNSFLLFRAGQHLCALPTTAVHQVVHLPAIARVPGQPPVLAGYLDVHGTPVPVVSLRLLFQQPPADPGLWTPVIIVNTSGGLLALLADTAEEVVNVDRGSLQELDANSSLNDCAVSEFAHNEGMVTVVSPERLLLVQESKRIAALQAEAQRRLSFVKDPDA